MNLSQKRLNQVLAWGTGLVTVFITPWFSYDPLNVSRMALLLVVASIVALLLASNAREFWSAPRRVTTVLVGLFVLQLFLVWIFAAANKVQQFFGAGGRQTGLLTYFALAIILLGALHASSKDLLLLVVQAVAISGALSIAYGFVQAAGGDPIGWTNPYSPVFGFFGNPNFQAAFMGFSAASLAVFILSGRIKPLWRGLSGIYIFSALFIIYASKSQQGFLVFAAGTTIAILVLFFKHEKFRRFKYLVLSISLIGLVAVLLDILQKSPWTSFLYKPSVSFRGDYWRAGWQMSLEHPVFGVGLDSYRDWFYRSRDLVTATRPEAGKYTDSAHNVLLDFSANGGFPLLIIYIALLVLTAVSAIKVLKRMNGFDPYFVAILTLWVGYLAQSLISINQIALALWGWLSAGLIIGYEINTRENDLTKKQITSKNRSTEHSAAVSLKMAGGLIMGLALGLPAFLADADFRSSIDSRNIERITATVNKWPQDVIRINYVAKLFEQNKLPDKALEAARVAVKFSPQMFQSWKIIYELPNTPPDEKAKALEMMRKLNPLNPDQP
jgi:O-antigen ligase